MSMTKIKKADNDVNDSIQSTTGRVAFIQRNPCED